MPSHSLPGWTPSCLQSQLLGLVRFMSIGHLDNPEVEIDYVTHSSAGFLGFMSFF